ncbi:ABC transporter permease [Calditerrivibrio nitroreducens]|uniref:Inner-membrane translocator n=1 Tax=Calditerrivibrio nitroreducens (strain DSM 19672 / NBRC 101217 / Yu37-1) TaxID=768670 RepID=E4TJC6_CALNY|nr:ABC transporter permease [Calditerrivibrio nitroreducens]ADR19193.1 inner-membrane translocator [Calditerrivibrio nitroreducens DSM 19672]
MIKIEKRISNSQYLKSLAKFSSFVIGILLSLFFLKFLGIEMIDLIKNIYFDAFGSIYSFTELLLKMVPLLICSIGVSFAFKMKLWNIGSEGQLYIGALASSLTAIYIPLNSHYFMIFMMFLAAFIAGGLWSGIAGFLKVKLNVNEIIVTLLMNYIAILIVDYLVYGPLKDPEGFNFPYSKKFTDIAKLTTFGDTRLHTGIVLAIFLLILYYILMEKSVWGYEVRVIGSNPNAAKYAGININKNILIIMVLSGGISALAGFTEVSGVLHRLQHSISPGYGYTAIIIAWLSNQSSIGILFSSLFMALIFIAGDTLQLNYQIPISMVNAFQGILLFALLTGDFFINHKITIKRRKNA